MARIPTQNNKCPHWSTLTQNCLVNAGGLYIPVSQHIKMYCRASIYEACPQFIRNDDTSAEAEINSLIRNTRRIHERVPGRYGIRIAECNDKGLAHTVIDESASTIDLSPGGIRLETYRELPVNSVVAFALGEDFLTPECSGIGQVKWCKSLDNAPVFHAGLAFLDKGVASTVSQYIGVAQ